NGKGPYNLVIDTGAPALVLARKLDESLDVTPDGGWATLDRVEIEGGVVLNKVAARFEDLYQLESMNGLGIAGVEVHGLVGYPVLARFRIEYDFAQPKLTWTPVDHATDELPRIARRGTATGGLDALGAMLKTFGRVLGMNKLAAPVPRGF